MGLGLFKAGKLNDRGIHVPMSVTIAHQNLDGNLYLSKGFYLTHYFEDYQLNIICSSPLQAPALVALSKFVIRKTSPV